MVFCVLRWTASIRKSMRSVSREWSFSNTAVVNSVFKEVWHVRHTHSEYISHDSTTFWLQGTRITIKLSPVNNCSCEMSILRCCIFLSESDSALDWRWHFETVWPDPAVIYCDTTVHSRRNRSEFASLDTETLGSFYMDTSGNFTFLSFCHFSTGSWFSKKLNQPVTTSIVKVTTSSIDPILG